MACYCPNIRCFDCDKYGHVAMNCPDKILPSGTPAHCRGNTTSKQIDPHLGIIAITGIPTMIIKIGTDSVIPDLPHTIIDSGVTAAMTPKGVVPKHFIDIHVVAPHATEAQVHTTTAVTHHIADLHPVEIFTKGQQISTTQIPQTTLQTSSRIFFKFTNNALEK